jgi:hypothetical protein
MDLASNHRGRGLTDYCLHHHHNTSDLLVLFHMGRQQNFHPTQASLLVPFLHAYWSRPQSPTRKGANKHDASDDVQLGTVCSTLSQSPLISKFLHVVVSCRVVSCRVPPAPVTVMLSFPSRKVDVGVEGREHDLDVEHKVQTLRLVSMHIILLICGGGYCCYCIFTTSRLYYCYLAYYWLISF